MKHSYKIYNCSDPWRPEEAQTSSWLATMEMGNWKGAWGRSGAAPVYRRGPKNRTSEYSCKSYGNPNTPIPHVTHHLWNFRDIRCLCTSAKCHSLSSSSKPSAKWASDQSLLFALCLQGKFYPGALNADYSCNEEKAKAQEKHRPDSQHLYYSYLG